jgi:Zn-dependent protease
MLDRNKSIHLFRVLGVDVFLHWSWFLVAAYEIGDRVHSYSSISFNILEYLALFVIILLHEFGHALACRQVGGVADRIVLWPLGGVAFVNPPQRPGATLWSITAGPLVNVVLFPVLFGIAVLGRSASPDVHALLVNVWKINAALLIFNILPVYPLDGGQILRSLLWFVFGRARSLMAAVVIGFLGVAGLLFLAIQEQSLWLGVICLFVLSNCWNGWKQAKALLRVAKLPRRDGFACPSCKSAPPIGSFWKCAHCGQPFDTFQARSTCPKCSASYPVTQCLDCGVPAPLDSWIAPVPAFSGR